MNVKWLQFGNHLVHLKSSHQPREHVAEVVFQLQVLANKDKSVG